MMNAVVFFMGPVIGNEGAPVATVVKNMAVSI
jgi:hypothetical protein